MTMEERRPKFGGNRDMTDLDIIKQIETELNIKLRESGEIGYSPNAKAKAYTLNKEGQVTGLGLYNCGMQNLN